MEVTHTPGHGGGPREDPVLLARLEAGADPPGEYTHRSGATGAEGARVTAAPSLIPPNLTMAGPHPIASHRHERRRVGGDPQEPEGPKWAIRPTAMARPGLSYVCGPSHQNLTNRREIVQRAGPAHRGRKPHSPRLEAKSGPRETTPDNVSDRPDRSHNPKVGGSNPPPATSSSGSSRAFAYAQRCDQRVRAGRRVEGPSFSGPYQSCVRMRMQGVRGETWPVSCGSAATGTSMSSSEAVLRMHA